MISVKEIPVTDLLDLHTFSPRDVKDIVEEYLYQCAQKKLRFVRIIHGKGIGNLRRTVQSILAKHPHVASYALAGEAFGGWGATIVHLKP